MTKRKSRSASPSSEFDEYDKILFDNNPDFHNGGKFNDFIDTVYKMEEDEKNKKREEQIADTKEKLAKIRHKKAAEALELLYFKHSGSKRTRTRSPSVGPAVGTVSRGGKRRSKKRRTQKRRR
jgi:hypothetical protein